MQHRCSMYKCCCQLATMLLVSYKCAGSDSSVAFQVKSRAQNRHIGLVDNCVQASTLDFTRNRVIRYHALKHNRVQERQFVKISYSRIYSGASSAYLNSSVCPWFPCSNTSILPHHSTLEVSQTRTKLNLQAPVVPLRPLHCCNTTAEG